jgi:TonB family protein
MNRLVLLELCAAVSCTQAPVQEPQPVPIPAGGAQAVPVQVEAPRAVSLDASAPGPSDDLQAYATAISRAIKARLILPSNVPDTAGAIYEITLSKNGAVAHLRAVRRSGFPAYDAAIRRAIQRAQPFPRLATADPAKPTRMQLTFKAKE